MGSAEKVCTMNIYKLFIVAKDLLYGNDSEKVVWEIERTVTLEVLGGIGHG